MKLKTTTFTIIEWVLFASLILYLFINQHNVPIFDEWALVGLVNHYYNGSLSLEILNDPHNECRMFYPHLVNLFIILSTKWSSFCLVLFNMVLFFGFYQIFKKNVKDIFIPENTIAAEIVFLLCLITMFSFKPYENIIMGFALNHFLTVSVTFFSFIVLQQITWKKVLLSCFLAHIATFSYVTGFFSWIGILLIIVLNDFLSNKEKIRYCSWVIILLITHLLIYFSNYHPVSEITVRTLNILKIVPYSLSFLSNNFTTTPFLSISFSVVQLMFIGSAFYLLYKHKREIINKILPLAMFALFGIFTGLITAYGRSSEGVIQSFSKRYCTISLPFNLIFLISILIHIEYVAYWKKYNPAKRTLFLFLGTLGTYIILYQVRFIQLANERNEKIMLAKDRIRHLDFGHKYVRENVFPYPQYLGDNVNVLKKYQISMYAYPSKEADTK